MTTDQHQAARNDGYANGYRAATADVAAYLTADPREALLALAAIAHVLAENGDERTAEHARRIAADLENVPSTGAWTEYAACLAEFGPHDDHAECARDLDYMNDPGDPGPMPDFGYGADAEDRRRQYGAQRYDVPADVDAYMVRQDAAHQKRAREAAYAARKARQEANGREWPEHDTAPCVAAREHLASALHARAECPAEAGQ